MTARLEIDGKPCTLLKDVKIEPIPSAPADMTFLERREFKVGEIAMAFGLSRGVAKFLIHFLGPIPPPRCRCRTCPTCQRLLARARARRARRHTRIRR